MTPPAQPSVTAEELAAVLAAVSHVDRASEPSGYDRWRRIRLAALRAGGLGHREAEQRG